MNMKKILALLLAVVLVVGLAACGGGSEKTTEGESKTEGAATSSEDAFELTVCLASEPQTIDPALNTTTDGANMILHAFEGLMTWKDDGQGKAVLELGQAESYEKVINDDGTVTYTFILREDIRWSDGQPVVAGDFEYAIKRLVNPKTASMYNYMADMLVNANEIMAGEEDPETLGVKALNDTTLEFTLVTDTPYFLEVTAFPALLPVRQDIVEANETQWTMDPATYVSNGPMKMNEWVHNAYISFVPNEEYYDQERVTVDVLNFQLMDDQNAMLSGFRNGDLDFIKEMPIDEIPGLIEAGEIEVMDYVGTYFVVFQNEVEPFDDPLVREAFSLVIDRNYIVNNITRAGQVPANAYVPAGVADAAGPGGADFYTTGGSGYISLDEADYEANCERARELLAEAGYPEGEGFPVVEYVYNTSDNHKTIAEALQAMWQDELNITVQLSNQDWAVFQQTRDNGEYQIARHGWIADYNDPITFLDMWVTGGGNNNAFFSNAEYDELIAKTKASSDPEERMDYMHQAEKILMDEAAVAPIYFYTEKKMLRPGLEGLYYSPLGYFFFMSVTEAQA